MGEEKIEVISILEREKSFKVCHQLKEGRETQLYSRLLLSHVTRKICSLRALDQGFILPYFSELNNVLQRNLELNERNKIDIRMKRNAVLIQVQTLKTKLKLNYILF